jgi:hypothetical protein
MRTDAMPSIQERTFATAGDDRENKTGCDCSCLALTTSDDASQHPQKAESLKSS